jgi:adenylosuccinate synthase
VKADILIGTQWGDEGKGKIVDALAGNYDIIARFQGGPNAGHSLEINEIKHVLHLIPSGVFHAEKLNIIGNGVVLDPVIFQEEIEGLKKIGINDFSNIMISNKAHLILPTHCALDGASEKSKGDTKIGSTLKGIAPVYRDKSGREGIRVGDIFLDDFKQKYTNLLEKHKKMLSLYNYDYDISEAEKKWFDAVELLKSFTIVNTEYVINTRISEGKSILAEGAQGTMLDVDYGSYPFVTSSNTISSGACKGLGVAPNKIGEVFGIFKAYCTRVGSGPFPTELNDHDGARLRDTGKEYGATTGRPRRCGWLDLVALKYAVMLNGVTQLIMTKADVLNGFETIKVATAYEIDGIQTGEIPFDLGKEVKPVYKEFQGWKTDISGSNTFDELPDALKAYIQFIENETNVPITIISVGADRNETIYK